MDKTCTLQDIHAAAAAQVKYCTDNQLPSFAPVDGKCWLCNKQIYADPYTREMAYKEVITGCPHCSATYCD